MKRVIVPVADGFEEIEAVTIVDILRRAGVEVVTASVAKERVAGSHGITIEDDTVIGDIDISAIDGIVLPGRVRPLSSPPNWCGTSPAPKPPMRSSRRFSLLDTGPPRSMFSLR